MAAGGFSVGQFRVDPAHNQLARGEEVVRLEPRVVEVLAVLASRPGQAVSRDELLAAVWPGVVVGDDALTQAIIKLRKALGDDAHKPTYIETISKRGYRLIAPVARDERPAAEVPAPATLSEPRRRPWIAAALVSLLVVVGAMLFWAAAHRPWPFGEGSPTAAVAPPLVAVLPLANLSGDPARDYFSDGVTEDLIHALGRFSALRVMSRNAVQPFKAGGGTPQSIREKLGARYVVEGSLRLEGSRIRVSVQLSDTEAGTVLWSERYEGEGGQVFEMQDRIARDVAGALAVKLTRVEQGRVSTKPTESLAAYDLVLRARGLLDRDERSANREARVLLAQAEKLAPDYAEVWNTMAWAELQRALYGWVEDPASSMERATELARRTLAAPDQRAHARAHAVLAAIHSNLLQYAEARQQADRAIQLNPSDTGALMRRGMALLYVGQVQEAIAVQEQARRFEPVPTATEGINLPLAYYLVGRYDEAIAESGRLLSRAPDHVGVLSILAAALAQQGREDEARQVAAQVLRFSPGFRADSSGRRFLDRRYAEHLHEGLRRAGLD
ncbi:MAG TPA: winged helix-turn-helix domain-containing protein [Usitatibacter sp.]|nr:winged helix-turn-helix domain-containing protein [Usitatibacter sp.]